MKCKWMNWTRLMLFIPALLISTTMFMANPAGAAPDEKKEDIEQKAMVALDNMGKFLRTLDLFSLNADISLDEVLLSGQKIMVNGTSLLKARRPNRLYLSIKIDETDKDNEYYYDGKTFTIFGNNNRYYASFEAPKTINELIDIAENHYNIEFPLRDLFAWGTDDSSISDIQSALFIDSTTIDGVACDHYAFRQEEVDWQIWIEPGKKPLPKRFVITSKLEDGQPQYISTMKWNLSPEMSEKDFVFTPPEDSYKIPFKVYDEEATN